MFHAVKPTRRQKHLISKSGINPNEWLVVQENRDGITILNKVSGELKTIDNK